MLLESYYICENKMQNDKGPLNTLLYIFFLPNREEFFKIVNLNLKWFWIGFHINWEIFLLCKNNAVKLPWSNSWRIVSLGTNAFRDPKAAARTEAGWLIKDN